MTDRKRLRKYVTVSAVRRVLEAHAECFTAAGEREGGCTVGEDIRDLIESPPDGVNIVEVTITQEVGDAGPP